MSRRILYFQMLRSALIEVTLLDQMQVLLPNAVVRPFIERGQSRVKIIARFESQQIEYHAALKKFNADNYVSYFSKAKQKALGVFLNDYFTMKLIEDSSKYGVEMPEELKAVLMSDPLAKELFEQLTPGKKRSLIYSILKIKNTDLRISKALNFCKNIKLGMTDQRSWLNP